MITTPCRSSCLPATMLTTWLMMTRSVRGEIGEHHVLLRPVTGEHLRPLRVGPDPVDAAALDDHRHEDLHVSADGPGVADGALHQHPAARCWIVGNRDSGCCRKRLTGEALLGNVRKENLQLEEVRIPKNLPKGSSYTAYPLAIPLRTLALQLRRSLTTSWSP